MATGSDDTVAPALKEQAVLETYFQCLSKFAHDRARDAIEHEREATKTKASLLWSSTLHLLNTLATSEKEFLSLVFLSPNLGSRLLGRKDALRTTYGCLLMELRKIEILPKTGAVRNNGGDGLEQLLGQLSGQLQHYVVARVNLIVFYEQLLAASSKVHSSLRELLRAIAAMSQDCRACIKHPILLCLKEAFCLECEAVRHLLEAQMCIQYLQFLPALHHLFNAQTKLASWGSAFASKEVKKLSFVGTSTKTTGPELYEWMSKFKAVLTAKFSFIFSEVLIRHGLAGEFKSLLSKASVDFYSRILLFHKKSDALNVSVLLNPADFDADFRGLGYQLPKEFCNMADTPGEPKSPTVIFSHPHEKLEKHLPTIFVLVMRKGQEISSDKVVMCYDERLQNTYFIVRVDPGILLVATFELRKQDRENFVANFLQTVANELRCTKIYSMLKPGSK